MTAADWLTRAHAVTDGATSGPWNFGHAGEHMTKAERQQWLADTCGDHDGPLWATWIMGDRGLADVVIPAATGDGERARGNADFIAASRTMLPAAVAAIEAVLALHRPAVRGEMGSINDGRCVVCVDFHADMDCEQEDYPCPTVRAITAHLDPS